MLKYFADVGVRGEFVELGRVDPALLWRRRVYGFDVEFDRSDPVFVQMNYPLAVQVFIRTPNQQSGLNQGLTSNQEAPGNTSLILNLLMLLVSDAGDEKDLRDGITPTMFEKVRIALERSASGDFSEIASAEAQSGSEWDRWVERITSEVPGLLLNVARDVRDYNGPAAALWGGCAQP